MPDVIQPTEGFVFRYDPDQKVTQGLASTDHGMLGVKVLSPGERSAVQQLNDVDVIALVKKGQARVLGNNDVELGVLSEADVITIPANTAFSVESTGNENLEFCEFFASHVVLPQEFAPFS